ncbi:MAG TPA: 1,2-phenylacetyl-CoA epoxidase subunit PaaC [Chitinophagaceae bacterium]|nr:1,2-phenylacetyl-CoA epoxidase subunit PaaC [Chitinophagaceae bacterium]
MNQALISYTIHLADNSLVLGHRNSEWCGHGPVLEQDIAITNISLDLIGQARYFYQYAADLMNQGCLSIPGHAGPVNEDVIAYLRREREYRNCLLVEQPNGDWAQTIFRQFLFSLYQELLYGELQHSRDEQLAAIAAKSLKEVAYHVRWASEWVIRLGDGTEESRTRMFRAMDSLWMYSGELFEPASYESEMAAPGIAPDLVPLKPRWEQKIREVLEEATLNSDFAGGAASGYMQRGGKDGRHTEYLGYILADLQYLQRAYPGCEW